MSADISGQKMMDNKKKGKKYENQEALKSVLLIFLVPLCLPSKTTFGPQTSSPNFLIIVPFQAAQ